MSEKRLASSGDSFVDLTEMQIVDLLNKLSDENTRLHKKVDEQQEKITELEIELTDCKNRKEQLEYKNTKLIAKIDFLERVIDGDV